jgi:hypothetical protein
MRQALTLGNETGSELGEYTHNCKSLWIKVSAKMAYIIIFPAPEPLTDYQTIFPAPEQSTDNQTILPTTQPSQKYQKGCAYTGSPVLIFFGVGLLTNHIRSSHIRSFSELI